MKLTLQEVAQRLDIPVSTVRRWVRQGRIPIRRSGGEYHVERPVLEQWAKKHNLLFSAPRQIRTAAIPADGDSLLTAIRRGGIHLDVEGEDVETALASAVERVPELDAEGRRTLYDRLLQRERMISTGIGKGVAIPHPRSPGENEISDPVIVTCFLREPAAYGALDGKPVFVLFLLLSPDARRHLHLLSRLSYCLRNDEFVAAMAARPSAEWFEARIAEIENGLDRKGGA
jgi:nitrogen PTS system EIIA component